MEGPKLGQRPTLESRRDAVHIAITPMVAAEQLLPGQRVQIDGYDRARSTYGNEESVGIVDPFLTEAVESGECFWLCLMPGSITSLRHVWSHPDFITSVEELKSPVRLPPGLVGDRQRLELALQIDPYDDMTRQVYADWLEEHGEENLAARQRAWTVEWQQSCDWLTNLAERSNLTPKSVIDGGQYYKEFQEKLYLASNEDVIGNLYNHTEEYWKHWSIYTGESIDGVDTKTIPFSCSC